MSVNLASRASAVTTDSQGKTHVVWAEGSFLWYAEYDNNSGTWKNAQAITTLENQDISNISFLYDDNLIQEDTTNNNSQPGFVVTWQQGSENDSDFYYTAGKYDENQQLQWLANPQAITTDQVGDLEPSAIVYNGDVLLVGSKVNVENANNQQIREDSDLYYQQFKVNDSLFTTTTTTPPNASYSPQISQDGVINGLIPIDTDNSTNTVNTLSSNTKLGINSELTSTTDETPPPISTGANFTWGGGITFSTSLLNVINAEETVPPGIVRKIISPFLNGFEITGMMTGGQSASDIRGASGDNLNPYLDVNATTSFSGKLAKKVAVLVVAPEVEGEELAEQKAQQETDKATEDKNKENSGSQSGFNVSLALDSKWTFDRETLLLDQIKDTATLSFGLTFGVDNKLYEFQVYANLGASFIVQAEPLPNGDYDPTIEAILATFGSEIGASILLGSIVGAGISLGGGDSKSALAGAIVAAVASSVFSTIADAIAISNDSEGLYYQTAIAFPVITAGGKFRLGLKFLNFSGQLGIGAGMIWGLENTPNVQYLQFPISAGVNLGPIYLGISLTPGWQWEAFNSDSSENTTSDVASSLANFSSESTNAIVQGSLLTINWGENLNTDNIPDSSQFTVTVTDNLGNITTIPVFQVSIESNTIQLRLSEVIPLSANYDYTTSNNPTPQPNLIQVSYTTSDNQSQNLQDSQGEEIDNFNLSVTNNSPDSFSATYNPTTGNSQNYSILNNELILSFNTPLNTNILPDVRRFTVEGATIDSLTVESNAIVLVLKLNDNVVADATVTYSNQQGLGNLLETVDNESIASFTIDSDITISQSQFVIGVQFTNTLNSNLIPNINQFLVQTIDNNGNVINTVTVNQVDIVNGNIVNLYLSQAIEENQTYRITYTPANNIATDLEYQDGTEVEGFTVVSNQENSQGITTNELTAILVQNLDSNVSFSNSINNYNVTLTDEVGNIQDSVTVQSLRVKSQGVELIINDNLTDNENVVIDYQNNGNEIKINSLVTGIEPPPFDTQSVIGNIEADLGQDSTPTLSLTKTGEILMAWVAEVAPIQPIAGFVNGDIIILNFVENLQNDSIPQPSQFTVTDTQGNIYNVDGAPSLLGNSLTLILDETIPESAQIKISYSFSPTKNNGNLYLTDATNTRLWINEFSNFNLTNNTNKNNSPTLLGAGSIVANVSGQNVNRITLVFDQTLTGNPIESQFSIENNGINYQLLNNPTVNGNTVTLNVIPPSGSGLIGAGDLVTVDYSNNINGNPVSTQQQLTSNNGIVAEFNNQPVITSPTTPTTVIKYGFTPSGDALLSTPSSIIGSKGLNFNPVAELDQKGNNVVMWVNADMSDIPTSLTPGEFYSDNQTNLINESLSQSDIYYSIYNAKTQEWSIASPLVSQEGSEGKIVLGMGENNQLIATWLNYTDEETNIYWSSLAYDSQDNGIWSEPQLLYQDASPDPLTELEIASINGKTAIFWTETQQVSYSQLTIEGSPILYFRLAENSGTVANNSGTWGAGGNGIYNGTVNYHQTGALENTTTNKGDKNPAVLFNNGSSLTLAEDLGLISGNSFTIELWFKIPNNLNETINIASMEGLFSLSVSQSLELTLNIDNQNISPDSPIDTDTWNYVVATYDGQSDTVILYLNGQPVVTRNNVDFTFPSTTNLTLAGGNDNLYLDEVAFYNKTLDYSDFIPSDLNSGNVSSLTGEQLISILSGDGTDIGSKYSAQYIAPLPPGANTYYAFIDDDIDTPSQIIPEYQVIATQLSDANKPQWDIVSNVSANSNSYIYPNGIPDIYLPLNLQNQQTGTKISSIEITAQDSNRNTFTWSVGNTQGNQLGVVQGETLLNPINPEGEFDYTILSPNVNLDLFIDGSNSNLSNFQYSINGSDPQNINTADVTSEPTTVNSNQVLGIATVTEANDSSLALIDSGFIINTDNASIGYILSNGDLDGDGKTDVIVGNRGYTDSDGNLLNNGTIQILLGGGDVLGNSENNPLTTTDLLGNPNGIFIKGIIDGGQANSDFPMSLAMGDVDGDGKDDLIIGAPNVNNGDGIVYVIKGSYLANNKGKTITINSDNSFSDGSNNSSNIGYVINPTVEGGYFGLAVAVGNFNGTGNADIAIGTPGANNGDGLVSIAYDGDTTATTFYTGTGKENLGYALTVSKAKGGQSFSKNTLVDDLIVGAPSFQASVANQWVGVDSFPQDNQNLFSSNTSAAVGKVYVFANNNINPLYSFTGSILPSSNGTAENSFTGSALASDDWDGDGIKDLAISAPGSDTNDGLVYVLKGGSVTSGDLDYISNLIILGGLQFGEAGSVITSAGDVNGDKYEDFLITAPQGAMGAGQGYVLFGPLNLEDVGTLFDLNVTATDNKKTFLLNSDRSYQSVGSSASSIGDVNNDGVDDLMITAPNAQQLYAVYGHQWLADDGSIKLADISGDNGFVIDGDLYNANSKSLNGNGNNVLILGDINGDGFADVLSGGSEYGAVVIFGSSTKNLLDASVGSNDLIVTVANHALKDVIALGDYNGDGLQDFGVLDTNNNFYLQLGSSNLSSLRNLSLSTPSVTSITSSIELGDYNGDGYDDILLNTSTYSTIYLGNKEGNFQNYIIFNPVDIDNMSIDNYTFGSIGDMNGDGYNDIGTGLPNTNSVIPEGNNGQFITYLGGNGTPISSLSLYNTGVDSNRVPLPNNSTDDPHYDLVSIPSGSDSDILVINSGDGISGWISPNNNNSNIAPPGNYIYRTTFTLPEGINPNNFTINGLWHTDDMGTMITLNNRAQYLSSFPNYNTDWIPFTINNGFVTGENTLEFTVNNAGSANNPTTLRVKFDTLLSINPVTNIVQPPNTNSLSSSLNNSEWSSFYIQAQQSPLPPGFAVYNGYLYMAYKGNDNNNIYVQRSTNGYNWEDLTELSLTTQEQPSLAVFNDTLYLAYNNDSTIYLSEFRGNSESISFSGGNFVVEGVNSSPSLLEYDNQLYIFSLSGDDIFYFTSENPDNLTWDVNFVEGQQSKDKLGVTVIPGSANNGAGNILMTYKDSKGDSIYTTLFNGSSWTGAKTIPNQETTDAPSPVTVNNTVYLFYEATKPNSLNYVTSTDGGNSWSSSQEIPNQLLNLGPSAVFYKENIYVGFSSQDESNNPIYVSVSNPIYNTNQTQQLGEQLHSIGDFNGDGITDFAVLASGYVANLGIIENNVLKNNTGAILIYYGNANGMSNSAQPDVVLVNPPVTDSNSPFYEINNFTSIGDINGDGFDDMAIASPTTNNNEGVVFVVFGGGEWKQYSTNNPFNLGSLSNNQSNGSNPNGFVIDGLPSSQAGISMSGGEDVNGDGLSDFTIGAPGNNDNLTYVIFGSDFNNTVNQTGTIGNDRMIGTVTGESFLGGEGNDKIYTNGGIDVVYASQGDDFVTVHDTYFRRLDGGTGTNTLKFTGYNGQDWDLTTLSPGSRLRNFEILDIENYGTNTLTLNSLTVTQLSSTNTITVLMDENDIVNLSDDFSYNDTIYQDNQKFNQYISNTSGATILINSNVVDSTLLSPISLSLYNTGVDDSGVTLPTNDTNDPHYELISFPNGSSSNILVVNSGDGISGWIAPDNNNSQSGPAGDYIYRTNFTLPDTIDLDKFSIIGQWRSDDEGTTIKLNGVEQYLSSNPNYNLDFIPFTISEGFITGNNTLEFTVNNAGTTINPTALRVKFDNALESNIQFWAPSTNTPQSILNPETISQVSSENSTLFAIDDSGNITAVSSTLSSSNNINNAPTRLFVSNPIANEADGKVEFKIDRTGNLDKYVKVHYITQDARGKAGSDYHPVLGRAVFQPGESSKIISVPLPLDDVYTGTREFGLLVTNEKESHTLLTDEFNLYVDPTDGQIRNWNHIIDDQPHSVMGGKLEFRLTTTEGKGEVKLYFEGNGDFNNYYAFNNETQKYEPFNFDGNIGAQFFDEDGDEKYEGAILHLQDGSKHDLDGVENGLMLTRGFFSDGETPEILLDTAMYRFRSLDTQGSYLYVGEEEKQSILANYSNNFIEEGLAFYVSDTLDDNLIAFNRFRNSSLPGAYIYAGEEETESIRSNYPQFIDEGIAFYAYDVGSQMTDNIDRFQNSTGGAYLYTAQPETQNVINNYSNSFNLEGMAFESLLV
ncbi:Calx-beta domain-containing protein [Geminocystis sp. NIES-3709]|uniref:Calx-beta domain-containing protein n=1 Tax=Geminocystis sp. NIES-3709 TaxID=1617448 RepID=UPI0005FCBD40|nr:Calx-beta domain-containing protein [Geminocystis sp. NIES-3709]BAQ63278.1 alkaline phosphatase [Geminocystis sp. NIES-3709]